MYTHTTVLACVTQYNHQRNKKNKVAGYISERYVWLCYSQIRYTPGYREDALLNMLGGKQQNINDIITMIMYVCNTYTDVCMYYIHILGAVCMYYVLLLYYIRWKQNILEVAEGPALRRELLREARRLCVDVCVYVCMYVCIYIYIYIYIHRHKYIYIYIYMYREIYRLRERETEM